MHSLELYKYLDSLPKDESVYFYPNSGNAGDALIAHATYQAFQKLGIRFKLLSRLHNVDGKVVLLGGGGNLVRYYRSCARILARVHQTAKQVIVLPQTINAHEPLLQNLGSNVDIICRERQSFAFVSSHARRANVLLMDDVAFSVDVRDTLQRQELRTYFSPIAWGYRCKCPIAKYLLTNKGKPHESKAGRKVLNGFRTDVERSCQIPPGNIDIARVLEIGFFHGPDHARMVARRLLTFIDRFDEINTNRLHVGVTGAMLDKTVNLYANSYHKNESVYEFSIRDRFPNVRWQGTDRDLSASSS